MAPQDYSATTGPLWERLGQLNRCSSGDGCEPDGGAGNGSQRGLPWDLNGSRGGFWGDDLLVDGLSLMDGSETLEGECTLGDPL